MKQLYLIAALLVCGLACLYLAWRGAVRVADELDEYRGFRSVGAGRGAP